jgi:hypothetical protein
MLRSVRIQIRRISKSSKICFWKKSDFENKNSYISLAQNILKIVFSSLDLVLLFKDFQT